MLIRRDTVKNGRCERWWKIWATENASNLLKCGKDATEIAQGDSEKDLDQGLENEKFSMKIVPKISTDDIWHDLSPHFDVDGDETWCFQYDSETKYRACNGGCSKTKKKKR